ncbi:MAG TPA: hypothetical protein VGE21_13465 [Flavobacteriales bacterium]
MIGSGACWALRARERRDWTSWLGAQLLLAILVQISAELYLLGHGNNHALFNVYVPMEFGLLLAMSYTFMHSRRERMVVLCAAWPFALAYLWELLHYGTFDRFVSTSFICGGFTLVAIYAYLLVRAVDRSSRPLSRTPVFWVFAGMVVYFAASAPIVGLLHYLNGLDKEVAASLFVINQVLAMVRYVAVGTGLCLLVNGDDRW